MAEQISIPRPRSKFLKVKCPDCGNEQIIYNKVNNQVTCLVCGTILAKPTGGKAEIKGQVIGVLDRHG